MQEDEGLSKVTEIRQVQEEVNDLIENEELSVRQIVKEHWLRYGDKKSKFFHACVKQRRRAKEISLIMDEEGRT